ncbi:MAG TPA: ABC transporter ATP-binding protein [Pseudobdellovibrionaceae bacterium]|nr:ABC transporter ATP-binding protein [Pseudobdellovibrionaceae bacterium]
MNRVLETLGKIWPYIRPYSSKLLLAFFFGGIISLCNAALPVLGKLLFQNVFEERNSVITLGSLQFSVWVLPLAFPVLYLVWGLARYVHYRTLIMINERVVGDIRRSCVEQALRLNLSFHAKFDSGSGGLMSRILNDTQVLQTGLNFFGDVLREPLIALALLGWMLWLDWKLTLGLLAFLPVFVLITKQVSRSLRKYGHASREAMESVTADIKENLDGVRVIQSFGLEASMGARLKRSMANYLAQRNQIVAREEAVSPINEFLASILVMGLLIWVIQQVFGGQSSGSDFISFLIAAGQIQNPIKRLQESFVRVQQTLVVSERIFGLIESQDRVRQASTPRAFPENWQKISFDRVSFSYGNDPVLRSVSLEVKRGEVIALVGSSGSGKSTLVNLLERFYDPTSGKISIDEIPLNEIRLDELRSRIALVTQDVFLFRDSIEANIRAGKGNPDVGDQGAVLRAAQHAHAHDFISRIPQDYRAQVGERGGLLSGGEKQRISIARAFYKDAPILILDEATSALDSVSEMEVQKGLNELMEGRTVFVIAHRLSTIRSADRIVVLKQGEIVEIGRHDELLAKQGEYFRFHQIQASAE